MIDSVTRIETTVTDDTAEFTIKVRLRCDIPEFQSEHFRGLSKSDTEIIARGTAEKISDIICKCINDTLYERNYDLFSLGRRINLKNTKLYQKITDGELKLSDISVFSIETEVEIRRIGKIILDKD